ncbi:MAG: hypothetical protein ABIH08_01005 [Candidatus Omnitrophota bacterium]
MYKIQPLTKVEKEIEIPPDKSISHRAIILSALTPKNTVISPFILNEDTKATIECVKLCGAKVILNAKNKILTVQGKGLYFSRKKKS